MKSAGLISSIICRIPSRGSDSAAAPASCTRDRRRAGADLGKGGGVQRSIPSLFIPRPRQLSHLSQPPNDLTFAHGAGRAGEPAAPRIRPNIPPERRVPLPPRKSGNDGHSGKKGDKEKQCDGAHGESRLWKGGESGGLEAQDWAPGEGGGWALPLSVSPPRRRNASHKNVRVGWRRRRGGGRGCALVRRRGRTSRTGMAVAGPRPARGGPPRARPRAVEAAHAQPHQLTWADRGRRERGRRCEQRERSSRRVPRKNNTLALYLVYRGGERGGGWYSRNNTHTSPTPRTNKNSVSGRWRGGKGGEGAGPGTKKTKHITSAQPPTHDFSFPSLLSTAPPQTARTAPPPSTGETRAPRPPPRRTRRAARPPPRTGRTRG